MTQFMNAGHRSERMKQIDELLDVPVHACRFIGCATMAICYVVTGVADVYFERGLKAWDMAAGIVIIKEAGGVVWDYSGTGQCDLTRREIIAARNTGIAQHILDIVTKN
jgi:myo-inositol-1(or 4)-monophosphatase